MRLEGELHLWTVDLDAHPAGASAELSAAEQARAAAFRFEHHRNRYLAAHLALRQILSRYTGVPPGAIRLAAGPHGKPCIHDPASAIRFNLAHSDSCALVGVACEREVGVDMERLRPLPEAESISSRYFHRDELSRVGPGADGFFRLWTMKEAYLKCVGMGLRLPLNSFSIFDEGLNREYVIAAIPAPENFVAAVVYPAPPLVRRVMEWPPHSGGA